ncbi:gliding motility-associated C-terminal domain-containing protein [Rufibacter immobilis]|uniref:Gliding motility-associated C-terminal domain-containing protein n=1 Tax=Rufibacter immobilis TaxID=1348778 RepID=A0A3M9MR94_9BACT|nr:T9SS type B sorting domain-containing protein [Rufibacter immobilis]RNI28036.1 gliding motility-associated C-terminal domain-containing protein [Rufibacter immobilis]
MKIRVLVTFIWCLSSLSAWAQDFLAYNERNQPVTVLCVGERITFRDNTPRSNDPNFSEFYDFDADDNQEKFEDPVHVFTIPGEYTVTQLAYGYEQRQRTFTVKANAPATSPVLQKLTLLPTGIELQLNTSGVNDLVLERASSSSGTFTVIQTLTAVPQGESPHLLSIDPNAGCYRVRVTNTCSGRQDIVSSTVCSQALFVTAGNRVNQLSWAANASSGSVSSYQLLRGGQPYKTFLNTQTSFTDTEVACGRLYTYQLVALLPNNVQSASVPVQVETQGSTPPAAPFLVASFDLQNRVMLQTVVPDQETFKEQTIYRSQGNAGFAQISEKQSLNALDSTSPALSAPLCYQATYTDSCSQTSGRSNSACPAILTATFQAEGSVQLTWNAYEGFPAGVGTQTLELLDEQGQVYWSTPVTGQSYLDEKPQTTYQRLTYRLLSKAQDGSYQSYSNTATADQAFQFHFPTAFSPNADGLNDVFRPVGSPFASSFTLQVLNRWGQIIFESKDPKNGWDGTYQGKPAPPETYLFRMEAKDVNGKRITQKGTVTLVK